MRIYEINSIEFSGRLKRGDIIKKLNKLNETAKINAKKLKMQCDKSSNACFDKIFDDSEHFTSKDYAKMIGMGCGSGTGTLSSVSSTSLSTIL